VKDLAVEIGERKACLQLGYPRPTFQRHNVRVRETVVDPVADPVCDAPSRQVRRYEARQAAREEHRQTRVRRRSSLALSDVERQAIIDVAHDPRFIDRSVPHIYAFSLDEGRYYGSMSTMYRVLRSVGEVGERRNQATHPARVKPELCATAPGRVWCWDISVLQQHGRSFAVSG
jgi:putative transposase